MGLRLLAVGALVLLASGCAPRVSPVYLKLKEMGLERYYIPSTPAFGRTTCLGTSTEGVVFINCW